jgi:hypothetical protein
VAAAILVLCKVVRDACSGRAIISPTTRLACDGSNLNLSPMMALLLPNYLSWPIIITPSQSISMAQAPPAPAAPDDSNTTEPSSSQAEAAADLHLALSEALAAWCKHQQGQRRHPTWQPQQPQEQQQLLQQQYYEQQFQQELHIALRNRHWRLVTELAKMLFARGIDDALAAAVCAALPEVHSPAAGSSRQEMFFDDDCYQALAKLLSSHASANKEGLRALLKDTGLISKLWQQLTDASKQAQAHRVRWDGRGPHGQVRSLWPGRGAEQAEQACWRHDVQHWCANNHIWCSQCGSTLLVTTLPVLPVHSST